MQILIFNNANSTEWMGKNLEGEAVNEVFFLSTLLHLRGETVKEPKTSARAI
jgi:hypothetical protein